VGARRLEVPVNDDDRDQDGDDIHDESEQQVLGDERNLHRGRGQDLGYEQQEHDQSQQDGNAHGHLFAGVSGQVEDADAEEGDENARDDEVDGVEQSLTTQLKLERDLRLVVALHLVVRVVVDSWT